MARTGHQVRQARYRLQSRRRSQRQRCLATTFISHALADGEADIFFDTWLPNTHEDYWKQYGDDVIDVKVWYNGKATNHIAVPEYMDIDSIDELEEVGDEVDWQISGIDAGAGLMRLTKGA